jgi:phage shock protein C
MTNSTQATETTKKLRRSRTDKMLTGVSGGWADYLGVDPTVLRIGLVGAAVLSAGVTLPLYAAAVFLTPEQEAAEAPETETETEPSAA